MKRNGVIVKRDLSEKDRALQELRDVTLELMHDVRMAVQLYESFNNEYLDPRPVGHSERVDLKAVSYDLMHHTYNTLQLIFEETL